LDDEDLAMLDAIIQQRDAVAEALENFRFRQAMERFIDLGRKANVYFDQKQPWVTRKSDMARTASTLYVCCQVVHGLCHLMAPFMPEGAGKLAGILNIELPSGGPDGGENIWNRAGTVLAEGSPLQSPSVLFPKLDPDMIAELAELHEQGRAQ